MLYIRADGNPEIGMGHVMRCLSIAEAAYSISGQKPVFLMADGACLSFVKERGFAGMALGTDYRRMESELSLLSGILKKEDIILVDSYQADADYYRQLQKLCRVACLEDMGTPYPVDLLVNYNIYAEGLRRNYERLPDVLLGVQYMPLREAFQSGTDYAVREKVTDVMITTGGSDPCFAAGAFVEGILAHELLRGKTDIMYHVVSGAMNRFAAELKSRYARLGNIAIHENVSDMKALMKQCDVAITAAGSTLYEICALGVPMVCFYFAQNQKQGAEAFARLTDIVNAGCFSENQEAVTANVLAALLRCIQEQSYRERLFCQEKKLVDGKGAVRLAEHIMHMGAQRKD